MKIATMITRAKKGDVKELTAFVEDIGSILECLDSEEIKSLIRSNQSTTRQVETAIKVAHEYDQDYVPISDIV